MITILSYLTILCRHVPTNRKSLNVIYGVPLNRSVDKLRKNIEHTDFTDKVKTAFPIALTLSMLILALYLLINYFTN